MSCHYSFYCLMNLISYLWCIVNCIKLAVWQCPASHVARYLGFMNIYTPIHIQSFLCHPISDCSHWWLTDDTYPAFNCRWHQMLHNVKMGSAYRFINFCPFIDLYCWCHQFLCKIVPKVKVAHIHYHNVIVHYHTWIHFNSRICLDKGKNHPEPVGLTGQMIVIPLHVRLNYITSFCPGVY